MCQGFFFLIQKYQMFEMTKQRNGGGDGGGDGG